MYKKDIDKIGKQLVTLPKGFNAFKKTEKLLLAREAMLKKDKKVDWGLSEQLAFGSLILDGHNVRLSG